MLQTVTDARRSASAFWISGGAKAEGYLGTLTSAIVCSNVSCNKTSVYIALGEPITGNQGMSGVKSPAIANFRYPSAAGKTQPEYVPFPIREDYREACEIQSLSPKASATLSRRCLQGMIRDFCKVSRPRLVDEVRALRKLADEEKLPRGVTHESIDAIDALRKIGNIGAHMETDINVIVDVDEGEARALIDLVEMLLEDWYVERFKREQRFAKVAQIAESKAQQKEPSDRIE